jgi:hypothetical protein
LLLLLVTGMNPMLVILLGAAAGCLVVALKLRLGISVSLEKAEGSRETITPIKRTATYANYQDVYFGEGI